MPEDFEIDDMKDVFGFPYVEANISKDDYYHFGTEYEGQSVIDVKGYDYFIESYKLYRMNLKIAHMDASYDMENMVFKLSENGRKVYEANMKAYGEKLWKEWGI